MKIATIAVRIPRTLRIPRPRREETPTEAFRRRLLARTPSTKELRRRLAQL